MARRTLPWLAWLLVLAVAVPALAAGLDLDSAKQQGLVGEQTDGYVGAVAPNPTPEVKALVAEVNAKRRAAYEGIARKNGTAPAAVAALAGQKLIDRAPSGAWIGDGSGHWYQKR
jgi:uncharacterized protein YdbL (DUF1318 family)